MEAIRHLEGDHLFSDDPSPHRQVLAPAAVNTATLTSEVVALPQDHMDHIQERLQGCADAEAQDMPLALTTTSRALSQQCPDQRILKVRNQSHNVSSF